MKKDQKKRRNGCAILEANTKELKDDEAGEEVAYGSKELERPFPVSPPGKAGAGGFPPRRTKRGSPHKRAAAPL